MTSDAGWKRLESLLLEHVPRLHAALQPPASAKQLADTERRLGLEFPDDLRVAYLLHNGSSDASGCPPFFVPIRADWMSLDQVQAHWSMKREVSARLSRDPYAPREVAVYGDGLVRQEYWNSKRIPVGRTWGGMDIFVDLWPGAVGTYGQLIEDHGLGEFSDASVVATGFDMYLNDFADRLEQGLINYVEGKSWINTATGEPVLDWRDLSGW